VNAPTPTPREGRGYNFYKERKGGGGIISIGSHLISLKEIIFITAGREKETSGRLCRRKKGCHRYEELTPSFCRKGKRVESYSSFERGGRGRARRRLSGTRERRWEFFQ